MQIHVWKNIEGLRAGCFLPSDKSLWVTTLKELHEKMEAAIAAVEGGMSIRKASAEFGVARSTLSDRVNGRSARGGRPPTLPSEQEDQDLLEEYLFTMADVGFGLSVGEFSHPKMCDTLHWKFFKFNQDGSYILLRRHYI